MKLILASASPRRRLLLAETGLRFEVLPAEVEEGLLPKETPPEMVLRHARMKALWAAERRPGRPVLAADTTVVLSGEIFNKPADMEDARRMLKKLSGRLHTVHTGVCLLWLAKKVEALECSASQVTFRELDEACINRYFQIVNPLDKAGAYGIQEGRELIIARYEGSFTNIMGLPMETVQRLLEEHGLAGEPAVRKRYRDMG